MKDTYPNFSLVRFCRLFGVTRQSYYKHFWQWEATTIEHEIIIRRVKEIRQNHPVLGGRKLYALLQPDLLQHQIKLGRDGLFDLLATNSLLIRQAQGPSLPAVITGTRNHCMHSDFIAASAAAAPNAGRNRRPHRTVICPATAGECLHGAEDPRSHRPPDRCRSPASGCRRQHARSDGRPARTDLYHQRCGNLVIDHVARGNW